MCLSGTTLPLPCERGFYCPSGSAYQHPCPSGTYGNISGLVEEWQCLLCDPGMYCRGTGTFLWPCLFCSTDLSCRQLLFKCIDVLLEKSMYFSSLLIIFAWREDYPHWAMCCRVCLCRGSQWTFTVRQCDRIPLPAWVLLPCRHICTTTMPKRNIQVDIFQYLHKHRMIWRCKTTQIVQY